MKIDKVNNINELAPASKALPRLLTENLSRNLCVCYDVRKQDVINAFTNGARTFEAISNKTYACQGSGCCQQQLERLIEVLAAHEFSNVSENEQAS